MRDFVDIVIPVFNGMPYVQRTLESCFAQTIPEIRVTVIDNASTDGTGRWIQEKYRNEGRLRLLRNATNIGMSANIKKCFESIEGVCYCFLCADDMLLSRSALEEAKAILDNDGNVGAVFSDLVYVDAGDRVLAKRSFGRSGVFDGKAVGRDSIIQTRNMFGIPLLVRSDLLRDTKPDSSLSYAGDADFAIQLAKKTRFYHIPKPLIGNRYHDRNASRSLHHLSRSQFLRIAQKNGYSLSPADRILMSGFAIKNAVLRRLFLLYSKIKTADHGQGGLVRTK